MGTLKPDASDAVDMTTDRLTLARTIEEAGIPRDGAERVASAIFDAIHDNVATKQDIEAVKQDIGAVRSEMAAMEQRLGARIDLVEHRLMTRLGALTVVLLGLLFTALHYWPPGH